MWPMLFWLAKETGALSPWFGSGSASILSAKTFDIASDTRLPFTTTEDPMSQDASSLTYKRQHGLTQGHHLACEEIMTALEECHARGFLWKSMGMCNDAKHHVTLCLRAERLKRTAANREAAKVQRDRIKRAWAEIDENS
ncbi:hypothetical protein F4859DRAFT_519722 [Xylaria cf. heliscus]|nr:hypothetical protein F4859DRAFT_519722 [Xylaria cf. heliscus]